MYYIKGKGYFENSGKPAMSKRKFDLQLAKVYGSQGDNESFTRLIIESRVAHTLLVQQYRLGQTSKD